MRYTKYSPSKPIDPSPLPLSSPDAATPSVSPKIDSPDEDQSTHASDSVFEMETLAKADLHRSNHSTVKNLVCKFVSIVNSTDPDETLPTMEPPTVSIVLTLSEPTVTAASAANPVSSAKPQDHEILPTAELISDLAASVLPDNTVIATVANPVSLEKPQVSVADPWTNLFKGPSKKLQGKGKAFTLSSGEACVKIPNSVIEKNRKSWESFIIGKFYSDPPSQGTIHNIVNGIWSRQYRDVSVSKMEGNAFLFRIPNASTRNHVLNQRLWQIEGQTMFVANWEPGVVPMKPELKSAPIWLELRNVPFKFFNEEGLEHIVGLVGHPKFLHPTTINKTNLEVA